MSSTHEVNRIRNFHKKALDHHMAVNGYFKATPDGRIALTVDGLAHFKARLEGKFGGQRADVLLAKAQAAMQAGDREFRIGGETFPLIDTEPEMRLPARFKTTLAADLWNARTSISQLFFSATYLG